MPEFIVTQTAKEFGEYQKKKAREQAGNALLALFIFIVGMGSICHLAGFFNG